MKWLKLFENFKQEEIDEFMSVIRDKFLELSDVGFKVEVDDKNSRPNLGNIININIESAKKNEPFKFSEVSYVIEEILLLNNEWLKTGPLFGFVDVFARRKDITYLIDNTSSQYEQRFENGIRRRGERISCTPIDGKVQWRFENTKALDRKTFASTEGNPLNLVCKDIELFFE